MTISRTLKAVVFGAVLALGGAVAALASGDGEAPEPEVAPAEIVIGNSVDVVEEEHFLSYIIPESLKEPEKAAATETMRGVERDAGLEDFWLISSKTEMLTESHRRDEALYLLPGQSVLRVWWQQIDLSWDLSILDEGERAQTGWTKGTTATVIDKGGHIQVIFVQDEIMGSVVLEKPPGHKNDPYEISPNEVEDLAKKMLASLTAGA